MVSPPPFPTLPTIGLASIVGAALVQDKVGFHFIPPPQKKRGFNLNHSKKRGGMTRVCTPPFFNIIISCVAAAHLPPRLAGREVSCPRHSFNLRAEGGGLAGVGLVGFGGEGALLYF